MSTVYIVKQKSSEKKHDNRERHVDYERHADRERPEGRERPEDRERPDGYVNRLELGKICENYEIKLTQPTGIEFVDGLNRKVLEFIRDDIKNDKSLENPEIIKSGDITGCIVHIMKWRGCRGYLVVQISDLGVKYLVYLVDHRSHSASCFGTSSELVQKNQVLQEFKEIIQDLKKKYEIYKFFGKIGNVEDSQFFLP